MLSTRNLKAGDVLDGRYRLERRVGGGGMGDVWEGTDTVLWRTVAVKILLADLVDDRGFRERFRREARAIAVMKGPGVVEVYDYGETDDGDAAIAYLIMEFVDGQPLSRLLGLWGKLGSADTLRIIGGVAEALQVAHGAGIVHRDIKPGNILVRDDGSVVLVDFGIARAGHNLTLTTTGVVLGTVTYMSPEQAAGENLTAASDLYSLGVVAHQCLAGSPPFKADTPLGVLSAHLRNAPPSLPPDVPREVDAIVARALQKDPSSRWPDGASFARACYEIRAMITAVDPPRHPSPPVEPVPQTPPNAPTLHTGPHTGAHPMPPAAPTAVAPPGTAAPRRRGRLWVAFASALVVITTAGAIAAASPWHDATSPGVAAATASGAVTDVHGQDIDEPVGDGEEGALPAPEGESDAASASAATETPSEGPTTAPAEGAEPTGGASTSPSPSATSPSPTPQPVSVPDLSGLSEALARQRIEEAGLTAAADPSSGTGDYSCGVVNQIPGANTQADPGTTVHFTVQKAADAASCKTESDETPPPTDPTP
ncbi:protein kinase domain-containing protein [Glycomyces arizonensis]|uniref:protein kinase domain-containing protein n=1 Tax=Glycomyces arizonensis TaxID=256035 RepID=UPI000428A309|nr:protein kinase [Glycomyces arizonensis]